MTHSKKTKKSSVPEVISKPSKFMHSSAEAASRTKGMTDEEILEQKLVKKPTDGKLPTGVLRSVTTSLKKKKQDKSFQADPVTQASESTTESSVSSFDNTIVSESETYKGQRAVTTWLAENGFSKWTVLFIEHEINMDSLQELQKEDLHEMGITKVGVKLNILRAVRQIQKTNNTKPKHRKERTN